MPAPTLFDLGSGMDTKGTIKKLMELEKIPIKRLAKENKIDSIKISAWGEVRKRTQNLQNKSQTLQSFSGSFAINEVKSSDPGAITGQAAPDINPGKQRIEIIQLADYHSLHSNPMILDQDLPAGKFKITVNEQTLDFDFSGGTPRALINYLKNRGLKIIETHGVQVDSNNLMLAMRSKKTGKAGKIIFEDQDGLLKQIGLTGNRQVEEKQPISKPVVFDEKQLSVMPATKTANKIYNLENKNTAINLQQDGRIVWKKKLGPDAVLEMTYSVAQRDQSKVDPKLPGKKDSKENKNIASRDGVIIGPEIGVKVGDITLDGYNIKRTPVSKQSGQQDKNLQNKTETRTKPGQIKIGFMWQDNGKTNERFVIKKTDTDLNPVNGKINLSVKALTGGKVVQAIWFENSGSQSRISELVLKDKIKKKVNKPLNESTAAQDAILKINGVKVTRPDNKGLTDIIEGVSLDLNRITTGPVVVSIETRSDDIVKEIKLWVASYNDLLGFCRQISKSQKNDLKPQVDKNGQVTENKQSGLFANDSTIRQLVTRVRTSTSGSFPMISNDGYRVLADIGISTGAIGQNWEDIKTGKLAIDEQKLRDALAKNPEGVRNLFASDVNEDNLKESGVSVGLIKILKPYNRKAGGLISARIQMIKDSIQSNKDEMYRKELALKTKENSLRRKFGRMERSVKQNKSIGDYLKSQNRQK